MTVEDATLEQVVAHLKILRLAGLAEVRRCEIVNEEEPASEVSSGEVAPTPVARSEERPPTTEEPKPRPSSSPAPQTTTLSVELKTLEAPLPLADPGEPWPSALSREDRAVELQRLAASVAGCVQCGELARTRKQTVFGVGDPSPRLVLLGEAPGEEEDKRGEPFVGRAGQLLDKMIAACKMRRDEVYILNVLKCRPPGNRNPLPAEATACRAFLDRQLEILQPEFILCLGAVAAKNLLGVDLSVGRMRGKLYRYRGAKIIVTYHPSYLLRQESAKREAWEDLKFLLREMGIDPTKRASDA